MSGVKSPKDAQKLASRTFRDRGAVVTENARQWTTYTFPDQYTVTIGRNERIALTLAKVKDVQERYGFDQSDNFGQMGTRPGKPVIELERLVASAHAKERLALMQRQAGVDMREILLCLRTPQRVLWSDDHESWLWIRDRIAVPVKEVGDRFIITSVLWGTRELFDKYPRPA